MQLDLDAGAFGLGGCVRWSLSSSSCSGRRVLLLDQTAGGVGPCNNGSSLVLCALCSVGLGFRTLVSHDVVTLDNHHAERTY